MLGGRFFGSLESGMNGSGGKRKGANNDKMGSYNGGNHNFSDGLRNASDCSSRMVESFLVSWCSFGSILGGISGAIASIGTLSLGGKIRISGMDSLCLWEREEPWSVPFPKSWSI